jgi:TolB-like protein/Tfp pilus assembly protein PilF
MPFDSKNISEVIVSILERQPRPISEIAPEAPPKLEAIIARAMAKEMDARYQTINDLLGDLKRQKRKLDIEAGIDESFSPDFSADTTAGQTVEDARKTVKEVAVGSSPVETRQTGRGAAGLIAKIKRHRRVAFACAAALVAAAALILYFARGNRPDGAGEAGGRPGGGPIDSVAVLPIANRSGDPDMEYLSDGITEGIINRLSESAGLKVMSRNSVFRFKGQEPAPAAVRRELGARAVVTGRIARRGEGFVLSVEVADAEDNAQLWGGQFDLKMADIVGVQDQVAARVIEKLRLATGGRAIGSRHTENAEAYQLYLRGRFYWNRRTEAGITKAVEFFKQAIGIDPGYARAYAGLADCYAMLVEYSAQPPRELFPKVKEAALKAIEIDDALAEAHTSLAAAYEYEWDWAEAEAQYRRAIELNPSYATARHWYAVFLASHLRGDEAAEEARRALELDPLSLIINTSAGRVLYSARRYDEAISQLRKTVELDPNFAEARFHLALAYEQKRMYAEAIREFHKSVELFSDRTMTAWVGRAQAVAGNRGEALRVLAELKVMARRKYVSPYLLAVIYAALGEKDRAIEWLEKVYEERSYYVVWLKVDPVFDILRPDPRFQDLLRRTGLAP